MRSDTPSSVYVIRDGGGFAMNTAALYQNRIHNFNECGVLLEKLLAQVPEGLSKGYNLREDERAQLLQVQIDVTTDQLRGLVACAVAEGYHWPGSPGWRSSIDLRMKVCLAALSTSSAFRVLEYCARACIDVRERSQASGRIDATATGPEMEDECVTDNPMRAVRGFILSVFFFARARFFVLSLLSDSRKN